MEIEKSTLFGITEDHLEEDQSLDAKFIKNKASTFFFQLDSNSMAPLIMKDDVLVVDRSIKPYHNAIVVVAYNQELFCRRYLELPRSAVFKAENPREQSFTVNAESEVMIWGVVVSMVRAFHE